MDMKTQQKTTLLAIRHGETRWNAEERYQGHGDSPLTETGRNQVKALGLRMKAFQFNSLIGSDLGRAQETATIIAHYTGHTVETDSRIRERNYGVLEGLTVPEIKSKYSEILKSWMRMTRIILSLRVKIIDNTISGILYLLKICCIRELVPTLPSSFTVGFLIAFFVTLQVFRWIVPVALQQTTPA
jgi:hypothetical protein